jgi:hypothetical protein
MEAVPSEHVFYQVFHQHHQQRLALNSIPKDL